MTSEDIKHQLIIQNLVVSVDVKRHVYLLIQNLIRQECSQSERERSMLFPKAVNSNSMHIVQELCESPGGRPGLSVLTSLLVSVDVKNY